MRLTLGFSPCPNDTFIFDALINAKLDTFGIDFAVVIADVEELNRRAFEGSLDITKLSYHTLAYVLPTYELLHAGSALGNNCGPLLIAKNHIPPNQIPNCKIAIPGKYTTANFLLSVAYPTATNRHEMLFSDIEQAILDNKVDAGLIIHENRFTYQNKGLVKLIDLGEYWETTTALPIPLGGIAIRRSLPLQLKQTINTLIKQSVEQALQHPANTLPYVSQYAQAMDTNVMMQHINLYVNNYSVDLGEVGIAAIEKLFALAQQKQLIPVYTSNILLPIVKS